MKKGDQIKLIGKFPSCGRDGIVGYCWPKIWRHTTAEVLYLDTLVCEDAIVHGRPFSLVPADFDIFSISCSWQS